MLIQRFINTLPNRKDEEFDFDECYSLVRFRSKRTEEVRKINSKQMCQFPKPPL